MEPKYGARMIEENRLTAFENRTRHRPYEVHFECPEFTCLCPLSGFPDFATILITYIPDEKCVELKSLKLYINQFRERSIFHEQVANIICDDLVSLLDPRSIEVRAVFNVRGNIKTTVVARHQKN